MAFCALTDDATVTYLCTTPYAPERERVVHALSVGIEWPFPDEELASCHPATPPPHHSRNDRDLGQLPIWS